MQRKLVAMIAVASVVVVSTMLVFAETTTVDDLQGLRPDTQGVETNAFWDTRAHLSYAVQSSQGVSTNAFDTSVLTVAVSNLDDINAQGGCIMIFR